MGKWQKPEPSTDAVDGLSKVLSQLQMLQGILLKKAEEDRKLARELRGKDEVKGGRSGMD